MVLAWFSSRLGKHQSVTPSMRTQENISVRRCEKNISLHLLIELRSRDVGYFMCFFLSPAISSISALSECSMMHQRPGWFWDWLTMDCKHVNEDFFDA